MLQFIIIILLGLQSCAIVMYGANISKVVPFNVKKHLPILVHCAAESYPDLFSNSKLDTCRDCLEARWKYGYDQAKHLGRYSNEYGKIDNTVAGVVTTTKVLEVEGNPAGYIKYTSCYPVKNLGKIDQLAVLKQYRGHDFGKLLVEHALDDFSLSENVYGVWVCTTTYAVGEKFYHKKLGFSFIDKQSSAHFLDEMLYVWGARIRT